MTTHTTHYQRPDGDDGEIEIEVEFSLTGGHPGTPPSLSYPGDPPEPPELEILGATIVETGASTELTDVENVAVEREIYDRLDDFFDDGPDPDDWRDYD